MAKMEQVRQVLDPFLQVVASFEEMKKSYSGEWFCYRIDDNTD